MTAYLNYPLALTTGCDYAQSFTFQAPSVPVQFTGCTARLQVRVTPLDPTPLIDLSTTPSSSGALYLGQAPPGPYGDSVANVAALATYNASAWVAGTLIYVVAGPAFYAWFPGGALPVDGITVVAGSGGQWLLTGTMVVSVAKLGVAVLKGVPRAAYTALVTFANGQTFPYLEGDVLVDQSQTQV